MADIRTCKWCGKQYDTHQAFSGGLGTGYCYSYCSLRCKNAAMREQQKERQRQDEETEKLLRRIGGGSKNKGCLIVAAIIGIVMLFFVSKQHNNGESGKMEEAQKVVATQFSSGEESNEQKKVKNNKEEVRSKQNYERYVVIDVSDLRIRMQPSTSAETLKWKDGSNRHPKKGEKFGCLGETDDFFNIDFNGKSVWVSKQYSHVESDDVQE